jgi:hypothetical protein
MPNKEIKAKCRNLGRARLIANKIATEALGIVHKRVFLV